MSAVPTSNKRERRSVSPASARHSGEGRNPVTGAFRRGAKVQDRIGDALPTSLPEGWRWATLGDTGRYINGVAFKPSDWIGEGLPIIRIQNLTDPQKPLNRTMREVDPIYRVETGDLLVSWSATLDAFLWDREPGLLNQHIFKVVPDENVVGRRFLFYLLKMAIAEMIKSEHLHGSTMKHINRGPFLAHKVLIPPLNVQEEIVADIEKQFTRLDAGGAALLRVQANLKRYRATVLKAACEGRLVPTEAELAKAEGRTYETGEQLLARILADRRENWKGRGKYKEPTAPDTTSLPPLPEGWTWATVEQIAAKVVDGVHKKPNYVPSGVPFVTVRNLTAGYGISFDKLSYVTQEDHAQFIKRADPERGDILISKDGTLGVVRVIETDVVFSIFVSVALVKPVHRAMSKFLGIAFSSPQVQSQMVPKGSGLQHIHLEDLRADCIPLAPHAEQSRIVAEVERRLSIIEELESAITASLQRATRLRQSVLQRAFSSPGALASYT
jgi:type I restriction enzyme S subunit